MMDVLSDNWVLMKEKGCLIYEKRDAIVSIPSNGVEGLTIKQLLPVLTYFESLKINT